MEKKQQAKPRQKLTDPQHLAIAMKLAKEAGLFIFTGSKHGKPQYVLYRKAQPRNIRLKMRSSPAALHKLVEQTARTLQPAGSPA